MPVLIIRSVIVIEKWSIEKQFQLKEVICFVISFRINSIPMERYWNVYVLVFLQYIVVCLLFRETVHKFNGKCMVWSV